MTIGVSPVGNKGYCEKCLLFVWWGLYLGLWRGWVGDVMHVWGSVVASFYHVVLGIEPQAIKFGGKHHRLLSHLTSSGSCNTSHQTSGQMETFL